MLLVELWNQKSEALDSQLWNSNSGVSFLPELSINVYGNTPAITHTSNSSGVFS